MSVSRKRVGPIGVGAAFAVLALGAPAAAEEPQGSPPAPSSPAAPPSLSSLSPSEPEPVYLLDRLAAGASLGYFNDDRSRVLSEIHFDFPFVVIRQKSLFILGSLQTSTFDDESDSGFGSFEAEDLEYRVEAGARDYLNNRIAVAAFLGQQGREQIDGPGSRWIRYLALGFESVGFPRPGGEARFEWRLAVGPVFDEESVEGDAVVRGAILLDLWRGSRSSVGIDGSFDSLFDGLQGQTEYRVGPRWTFPLANGIRATVFSEWIRGRNPLGIEAQGWNFGFRYDEGAYSGPRTMPLPDVRGVLAFGRGSSRGLGRFDLDLASPEIRIGSIAGFVFANLDANVVSGTGLDNLYYIARAGMDLGIGGRLMAGPALYHRSNYALADVSQGSTSVNIVQAVIRTVNWDYADRLPRTLSPEHGARWYDRLEGFLAPGFVTESSFTEGQSWDIQAGARYDFVPRDRSIVPFVRVFGQWGGAERRDVSAGIATAQNLVFEVLYRRDDQYFGDDREDVFLVGSLVF